MKALITAGRAVTKLLLVMSVLLGPSRSAVLPFPRKQLTYSVVKYPTYKQHGGFSKSYVDVTLKRSLALWSAASPVRFRRAKRDEKADILLSFASLDHGDGVPFDGRGSDIAHTFYPDDASRKGQIHLDDDEPWSLGARDGRGRNLFWTLAHEAGHALGLRHNFESLDALMAPGYRGYEESVPSLKPSDITAIRALYGKEKDSEKKQEITVKKARIVGCMPERFDAVFQLPNTNIYAVHGSQVWRLKRRTKKEGSGCVVPSSSALKDLFPGYSGTVDTIYTDQLDYTWLLKGTTAQRADAASERGVRLENVYSFDTQPQFKAVPLNPITAVLPLPDSQQKFFFAGSKYWLDKKGDGGVEGSILPVSLIHPQLEKVDAAFAMRKPDGGASFFLFSSSLVYEVTLEGKGLKSLAGYPRSVTEEWNLLPATRR